MNGHYFKPIERHYSSLWLYRLQEGAFIWIVLHHELFLLLPSLVQPLFITSFFASIVYSVIENDLGLAMSSCDVDDGQWVVHILVDDSEINDMRHANWCRHQIIVCAESRPRHVIHGWKIVLCCISVWCLKPFVAKSTCWINKQLFFISIINIQYTHIIIQYTFCQKNCTKFQNFSCICICSQRRDH